MADTQVATNLAAIQGNIFGGFFKDHQAFLFLKFSDAGQAREWLAYLIDDIASTEEVLAFNNAFKLVKKRHHGREGVVKATWTNVAFTFSGLQALGLPDEELTFPVDFKEGMAARGAGIGDVDESAPENWIPPLRGVRGDGVLIVAADDPADLEAEVAQLQWGLDTHGIEVIYRQNGTVRSGTDPDHGGDQHGHEHFGFDDGVSQPGVRDDRVTAPGEDPDVGLPGQDRLWPGEWVLGYPKQNGLSSDGTPEGKPDTAPGDISHDTEPAWANDGSYMVFRRLRQDVKGFRDFVAQQAQDQGISADLMGAKIVGRYATGCPLEIADGQDDHFDTTAVDPSIADGTLLNDDRINAFDFRESDKGHEPRDDSDGHRVPRAAHIRKVYPRNEVPPGETFAETRRILRRGIAFGDSFDADADPAGPTGADSAFPDDRGLLFVCYQNSISSKFEFLMRAWVNKDGFPATGDGHDLVISQADATRTFNLPGGNPTTVTAPARWVVTTGGDYFFQPSIPALRHLAGLG